MKFAIWPLLVVTMGLGPQGKTNKKQWASKTHWVTFVITLNSVSVLLLPSPIYIIVFWISMTLLAVLFTTSSSKERKKASSHGSNIFSFRFISCDVFVFSESKRSVVRADGVSVCGGFLGSMVGSRSFFPLVSRLLAP